MLIDHDDKAGYLRILKTDQNPKKGRLLPELKNCNTLDDVYKKLRDKQGIY